MSSENVNIGAEPTGIPLFLRKSSLEVNGWRIPHFPRIDDPVVHIHKIQELPIREDDVLIAAYPKSGTHWLWEVTHMLLNQTTEYEKRVKEQVMLEFAGALEAVEKEPSPRILNSHLVFPHLPLEVITKKIKIIHVTRNPKDTLVSLYHHFKQLTPRASFTFDLLLKTVMENNIMFPSQYDYLRQMTEFEQTHPDHPIKHIYFEEMKKDPVKTISSLAKFLGVPASDTFCQHVAEACSFDNMKRVEDEGKKVMPKSMVDSLDQRGQTPAGVKQLDGGMPPHGGSPPHHGGKRPPAKMSFYRKGVVGDWKNSFTPEQSLEFDNYIKMEENKGFPFKFEYE
ncbi:unnamed protein product [Lymnaea stagnalis]|uniref:Sulfotransferase domain-containing protein n=1 Tax=Lymnaea stagnalis TaxID=6523 RepID=A0AAV2IS70_LYMST